MTDEERAYAQLLLCPPQALDVDGAAASGAPGPPAAAGYGAGGGGGQQGPGMQLLPPHLRELIMAGSGAVPGCGGAAAGLEALQQQLTAAGAREGLVHGQAALALPGATGGASSLQGGITGTAIASGGGGAWSWRAVAAVGSKQPGPAAVPRPQSAGGGAAARGARETVCIGGIPTGRRTVEAGSIGFSGAYRKQQRG